MNKTKITLIVTLILAVVAGFVIFNKSNSTLDKGLQGFSVSDTASISKIFLSDKADNSILLERQKSGKWLLNNDFNAHPDNVNTFLLTVANLRCANRLPKLHTTTFLPYLRHDQ